MAIVAGAKIHTRAREIPERRDATRARKMRGQIGAILEYPATYLQIFKFNEMQISGRVF